ncbi:hypothetical protein [Hoeflea sp.]|uniref:hypothetical protein n=1 Tax=Hoeflea sp. TaxID=1940281 RepID=UPI003B51A7A3
MKEAFGENPTRLQILLTLAVASVCAAFVLASQGGFNWQLVIVSVLAFDIGAGIISNSAVSTRTYWASLPKWSVAAFAAVHIAEIPVIFWLIGDSEISRALACALLAKISVFLIGQAECRATRLEQPGNDDYGIG